MPMHSPSPAGSKRCWTYFKNMPPALLWLYLPQHLLLNLVTVVCLCRVDAFRGALGIEA